jgi:hypothetical protein
MRIRAVLFLGAAAVSTIHALAADPPVRRPLDPGQRTAVLALMHAVDVAQAADVAGAALEFESQPLKGPNRAAYVPFRVGTKSLENVKSAAMYVRAVSRHDGFRSREEQSGLREWVERGGSAVPALQPTVAVAPGEMPIGGPAIASSRQATQNAAERSALLALQQQQYEKEKAAHESAAKREANQERDPLRFPFEEYYFADGSGRAIERALTLPPGEYDLYVALVDRAKVATSSPVVLRRVLTVPDYWNDELSLSPVILVKEFRQLKAPLAAKDQAEHPYTFGLVDVVPAATTTFTTSDTLTVVYQIANYGAPDVDVVANYSFFHQVNGRRTLFNRTNPQPLGDGDLPAPANWSTQGFVSQAVPLAQFPPGDYELEIAARDRLTRHTATTTVTFTVR